MNNLFGINHIANLFSLSVGCIKSMIDDKDEPTFSALCERCNKDYGKVRPHLRRTTGQFQFKHNIPKDIKPILESAGVGKTSELILTPYMFCDKCWKKILKKIKGLPIKLIPSSDDILCNVCGITENFGIYTIPLLDHKYVKSGLYSLWLCRRCHNTGNKLSALPTTAYIYVDRSLGYSVWQWDAKSTILKESRYCRKIDLFYVFISARIHQQGIVWRYRVPIDILKMIVALA